MYTITEAGMESRDLVLEPTFVGDCAIVRATGEIDLRTAPRLRDALNQQGTLHLVVDLRGVEFIDSSGLGVLVGALKRQRQRDGSLVVVAKRGDRVWRLFELTRMGVAFNLRTSVIDAIAEDANWRAATVCNPKAWCVQQGLR